MVRAVLSARVLRFTCLAMAAALVTAGCSPKRKAQGTAAPAESTSASPSGTPPTACPLTNQPSPQGSVPNRPAFAVKVANATLARPQIGLDAADIVYEEPVEGGITRFIAIYQCRDATRVEPVRSARFVDIDVLAQFGRPIFGHAGGIDPVMSALKSANLIDANYSGTFQGDYHRDSSRPAPDNLYTSTPEIYATAGNAGGPPSPVFRYLPAPAGGAGAPFPTSTVTGTVAPGSSLHVPFSGPDYDVVWQWNTAGAYLRNYGSTPARLASGAQISTQNVVVQQVSVVPSQYVEDAGGGRQNLIGTIGTGPAIVCRLGACVGGTWTRATRADVTRYDDPAGHQIPLAPGTTWVELEPNSQRPATS